MADNTTITFGFTLIGIGGSRDSWGDKLNANWAALDAALKSARDTAAAALPKAGGEVTGEVRRAGQGALPHWSADALDAGDMFLTPAGAPSPLTAPGQVWFGYSA